MYRSTEIDMEDGEIIDSDSENTQINVKHQSKCQQIFPTPSNVVGIFPRKLKTSSDSESDGLSGAENDGNCSDENIKKINGLRPCKEKSKYSVWSSVIQDQILSGDLSSWTGVNQPVNMIDRSVESYAIFETDYERCPKKQKLDLERFSDSDDDEEEADLNSLETFGAPKVSDDKSSRSRKSPDRGMRKKVHQRGEKKAHAKEEKMVQLKEEKKRKMRNHKEMKSMNRNMFQSSTPACDIVTEVLTVLQEPEHMRSMFELVLNAIGVDRLFKLLKATEDVEVTGGLMILNGQRRRTPGGVFLHLLKSQTNKEEQDQIFIQEKLEKLDRIKKKKERKKQLVDEKTRHLSQLVAATSSKGEPSTASAADDKAAFDDRLMDQDDIELDFVN